VKLERRAKERGRRKGIDLRQKTKLGKNGK
jgi:hypothetical protein